MTMIPKLTLLEREKGTQSTFENPRQMFTLKDPVGAKVKSPTCLGGESPQVRMIHGRFFFAQPNQGSDPWCLFNKQLPLVEPVFSNQSDLWRSWL